jgi:hypothetical protein
MLRSKGNYVNIVLGDDKHSRDQLKKQTAVFALHLSKETLLGEAQVENIQLRMGEGSVEMVLK